MSRRERKREAAPPSSARTPGQGSPSFEGRAPLDLAEVPPPRGLDDLARRAGGYLRVYRLGGCSVIVTREHGRWHLSVARPDRYPTWDEIAEARYRLLPDSIFAALVLPPKAHYVNLNPNCFQIVEIDDPTPKGLPP